MSRGLQMQFACSGEFRRGRVEVLREAGTRKYAVELGDGLCSSNERPSDHLQPLGQLPQKAQNLRGLVFAELHKLIVGLHRFEWLEEYGLTGSACSVHDAGHAAAVLGTHRDHEAVVAQRDIV